MRDEKDVADPLPPRFLAAIQGALDAAAWVREANDAQFDQQPTVRIRRRSSQCGAWIAVISNEYISEVHIIEWDGEELHHVRVEEDERVLVAASVRAYEKEGNMNSVRVSKKDLLEIVKKNREGHRKIFLEAQEGFRAEVVKELDIRLEAARNGKRVLGYLNLPAPTDQTKEYDKVISMLTMSVEDVVELDHESYSAYVLDDWHWRQQFLTSNAVYSGTARAITEAAQ